MEQRPAMLSSKGGEAIFLAAGQPGMTTTARSVEGSGLNRRRMSGLMKRTRFPAEITSQQGKKHQLKVQSYADTVTTNGNLRVRKNNQVKQPKIDKGHGKLTVRDFESPMPIVYNPFNEMAHDDPLLSRTQHLLQEANTTRYSTPLTRGGQMSPNNWRQRVNTGRRQSNVTPKSVNPSPYKTRIKAGKMENKDIVRETGNNSTLFNGMNNSLRPRGAKLKRLLNNHPFSGQSKKDSVTA